MIIRKKENWFRMLFIWRGSVIPRILPRLIMLFILSCLIVYCKGTFFQYKIPLNPAPFTLFGIALAIFLGFRNTVSYDRYWEARKLWGALLNTARSLTRQAISLSGYEQSDERIKTFAQYLVTFTWCLNHQLRSTDTSVDIDKRLGPSLASRIQAVKYKPIMLMEEMALWIKNARVNGNMDSIAQNTFEVNLNSLSDIVGGCERIAGNPIPYSYSVLLHRTVYIYCFLLSFGFVDSLGWLTPLIVMFIAYTFVALDAIASEIEDPFGMEDNDLALNEMCKMIETTVLEMTGMPDPGYEINHSIIRN